MNQLESIHKAMEGIFHEEVRDVGVMSHLFTFGFQRTGQGRQEVQKALKNVGEMSVLRG